MTSAEKDLRVAELVETALELNIAEWPAFLDRACADDPDLRREVESLLECEKQSQRFIEKPAVQTHARTLLEGQELGETTLAPGNSLGDYKIVSLLGEGGMGEVYLAEDASLQRKVAIKLIKRGLGTQAIIGRFHYEEKILAALNHHNIARLYDAAVSPEGWPYFVMEYVEGERLDRYCDERDLSIKDRLQLFAKICSAIAYAHQRLIIHRDIKPANIRVTADGEPKLLDFGIARLLDPKTTSAGEHTIMLQGLMTPEYASPEQIRGEEMTTASDIYSLGVVLYELLTGQKPFETPAGAPNESMRVRGQTPARPSTAVMRGQSLPPQLRHPRLLRGDLDNIVLMAIREEAARRYPSVGQFAEDIRQYLVGRPVIARKDTWSYRTAKLIKRNKVAAGSAALILLILVAGIIAISHEATVAKEERTKAEQRFDDVRKLAHSYLFELHDAIEKLPGSTPARELLVKRALEYLDSLAHEARDDPSLQRELVSAYIKVGNVQGNPNNANLGDTAGALASYRKALAIVEPLTLINDGKQAETQRLFAVAQEKMADVLDATGEIPTAVQRSNRSLEIFKALAESQPRDMKAQQSLAISLIKVGDVLGNPNFLNSGDVAGAMQNYQASLAIWQRLSQKNPANTTVRRFLGITYERIGTLLEAAQNTAEALTNYRKSLVIREKLARNFPADSDALRDAAIIDEKIANVLTSEGDLTGALESRQKSLQTFKNLVTADPENAQARQSLAISYVHLGDLLGYPDAPNLQRGPEASNAYQLALKTLSSSTEPTEAKTRETLAIIHERIGSMEALSGKSGRALSEYDKAFQLEQALIRNAASLERVAELSEKVGAIKVALAASLTTPVNQRKECWRVARIWFERSLAAWRESQQHGNVSKKANEKIEHVEAELEKCVASTAGR